MKKNCPKIHVATSAGESLGSYATSPEPTAAKHAFVRFWPPWWTPPGCRAAASERSSSDEAQSGGWSPAAERRE